MAAATRGHVFPSTRGQAAAHLSMTQGLWVSTTTTLSLCALALCMISVPAQAAQAAKAGPVTINSDAGFTAANGVDNPGAAGTPADPFLLVSIVCTAEIATVGACITVRDTTKAFVVRGLSSYNYSCGLNVTNARDFTLTGASTVVAVAPAPASGGDPSTGADAAGVWLTNTTNALIQDTTLAAITADVPNGCAGTAAGIVLAGVFADGVRVESVNVSAAAGNSTSNVFSCGSYPRAGNAVGVRLIAGPPADECAQCLHVTDLNVTNSRLTVQAGAVGPRPTAAGLGLDVEGSDSLEQFSAVTFTGLLRLADTVFESVKGPGGAFGVPLGEATMPGVRVVLERLSMPCLAAAGDLGGDVVAVSLTAGSPGPASVSITDLEIGAESAATGCGVTAGHGSTTRGLPWGARCGGNALGLSIGTVPDSATAVNGVTMWSMTAGDGAAGTSSDGSWPSDAGGDAGSATGISIQPTCTACVVTGARVLGALVAGSGGAGGAGNGGWNPSAGGNGGDAVGVWLPSDFAREGIEVTATLTPGAGGKGGEWPKYPSDPGANGVAGNATAFREWGSKHM